MKKETLFKKFFYALSSNFISMLVSVVVTLLVPRYFGSNVEQYGYLQLYLFYTGYVGFFHFGWVDGILLREGGKRYSDLDKALYSSQFTYFCFFEFVITTVMTLLVLIGTRGEDCFVLAMSALNILVLMPRSFLQYVLQATNRIKEYSVIVSACRLLYLVLSLVMMLCGAPSYHLFVIADLVSKTVTLFAALYYCRDFIFKKRLSAARQLVLREIGQNLSVGVKLVFANVASMLITGIVRFCIEQKWDVATFGQVSLTLNISSMLITFISAIAVVLFPTLRQMDRSVLPSLYDKLKGYLMIPAMGILVFYYPCKVVLTIFLPHYTEGLRFMALLFPMLVFEAKMSMLIKTYLQVLRHEAFLMWINIVSVGVSLVMSLLSVFVLENLTLAVMTILVNMVFRAMVSEIYLSKKIGIRIGRDIVFELALVALFVSTAWFLNSWVGTLIYSAGFAVYGISRRRVIGNMVSDIKALLHK